MLRHEDIIKACKVKQAEYDSLPKQLLLVRIEMSSPLSVIDHVKLDGIMAYFSMLDLFGDLAYAVPDSYVCDPPLPLERCANQNGVWWWKASFGVLSLNNEYIARWKKRWDEKNDDLVDFAGRMARVTHKHGFFKAFDMPLVVKNPSEIRFCCHGNKAEVERLLADVTHIGKKRSQGYGKVREITVRETDEDWSCWHKSGSASRAIPFDFDAEKEGHSLSRMAYKPPYWHPSNTAFCYRLGV